MKRALILVIAASFAASASAANLLSNGSFENGLANVGSFTTLSSGDSSSITDWTVGDAGVDYIGTYWTAQEGARSIDLSALGAGSVSQTVNSLVAGNYELAFYMWGNQAGPPTMKHFDLLINNVAVQSNVSVDPNLGWTLYAYNFAASGNTTITFRSADNTAYGPALDNVTLNAVPEPFTMSLGLASAGLFLRRRLKAKRA